MFVPGDPRFDEILRLAPQARGSGLRDQERPRWRELVGVLLGEMKDHGLAPERRQHIRAPVELAVDVLAPEEVAALTTSSISSGGLALRIQKVLPVGTALDLSIKVEERR